MSGPLFKDWYVNCFIPTVKAYCRRKNLTFKILLLLDNAPCHPSYLSDIDENVKIVFLPSNVTSILQPMDQGAISALKMNFKHLLMTAAIKAAEGKKVTLTNFL